MCGIAAIFAKSPEVEARLGALLAGMLGQLADRGPDSVGVALYRNPVEPGRTKVSALDPTGRPVDWSALDGAEVLAGGGDAAVLAVEAADGIAWLAERAPWLTPLAAGRSIEVHKRRGRPDALDAHVGLSGLAASHGLGHTRMATESAVTTSGAHPFSTGEDLCLVHNGSLSNHNRLRDRLRRQGIAFQTNNDSEVAAGYLQWRMREGDDLETALHAALADLDGFFTFAVGSADGFAVLRDPVACKPAVLAETDDWVAMGSEFRALATLPGAADAEVWEPAPGQVYAWTRVAVAAP